MVWTHGERVEGWMQNAAGCASVVMLTAQLVFKWILLLVFDARQPFFFLPNLPLQKLV